MIASTADKSWFPCAAQLSHLRLVSFCSCFLFGVALLDLNLNLPLIFWHLETFILLSSEMRLARPGLTSHFLLDKHAKESKEGWDLGEPPQIKQTRTEGDEV